MLISSVWRDMARRYFIAGLVLGGASIGVLCALLGSLLIRWWLPTSWGVWIALALVCCAVLVDFGLVRLRVPQNARQVPERIEASGPRFGALQFGFEMGTGLRTYMTSAIPHAVALSLIIGAPEYAVLGGLGFGLGRAIVPLARAVPGNDPEWTVTFERLASPIRAVLGISLACAVLILGLT